MIKSALRRIFGAIALAGVLLGGAYLAARHGGAGQLHFNEVHREPLGEGAELVRAELYRGAVTAGQLVAVFIDPAKVTIEVVLNPDKKPLSALAPTAKLIMNAGYFTPEYRPTGLLVSNGETLSPFVSSGGAAGSGVLLVENREVGLFRREDIKSRGFEGADLAIQAGPRLLEADGRPGIHSDNGQHANRSFIGADARGRLMLGVVYRADSGLGGGPSLYELQALLLELEPHTPRVAFALNLDGGPSTGLHLRTKPAIDLPESATVYSALTVQAEW